LFQPNGVELDMITDLHLFRQVVVGSCAIVAREPGQGRKAAALSGTRSVPQITWPPPSGTGVMGV